MKSVLTKRAVKQTWLGYMVVGCITIVAGVFTNLLAMIKGITGIKGITINTFGVLMILYGLVLINHATLVRGQSEIKKSITDLKEKIGELGKRK